MTLPNLVNKPTFFQKIQALIDPIALIQRSGQEYPDIFTIQRINSGRPLVFVSHPQGLQEIFTNDRKKFAALGKDNLGWKPLLGENSIFMLEGDRHKKRRQLLMPSLHGDRMRAYGQRLAVCSSPISGKIYIPITRNLDQNAFSNANFLPLNLCHLVPAPVAVWAMLWRYLK